MERFRYPQVVVRGLSVRSSDSEIATPSSSVSSASPALIDDETVYVAVGKDKSETEYAFSWILPRLGGNKIVILHIHQPSQTLSMDSPPIIGTIRRIRDQQVAERKDAEKILHKYILHCQKKGVQADKLFLEKNPDEIDPIEKGIVELISTHKIRRLVMGATEKKHYTKNLVELKSKKAIYVYRQAPPFCQIQFLCKGHLIHTREAMPVGLNTDGMTPLPQACPSTRSSIAESSSDFLSQRSPSLISSVSSSSLNDIRYYSASAFNTWTEGNGNEIDGDLPCHSGKDDSNTSFRPLEAGGTANAELLHKLHQYMEEVDKERTKRRKAEWEAVEAVFQAKVLESRFAEEVKHRKEVEDALAQDKEEIEKRNNQLHEIQKKLEISWEQKSSLEIQIEASERMVRELEQKMLSALELQKKYEDERDDLEVKLDDARKELVELRNKLAEKESSASMSSCYFSEYCLAEIEQATCHFDPALKIGEGGYGSTYKGFLRHTHVAIKILDQDSRQGPLEFQQEVYILSKLRHPNIVTLVGACPEACALIYEYVQNGSLEDRLNCKGNTPPLTWQTRIRIALEICSVLIFLHSCGPERVVHGDLKPSNILLDAKYVSKLSDFGISHILKENEFSENNTTLCRITGPQGTLAYLDPEFFMTGELTRKSDVYSFGIILLRLLTGKPAMGIVKEVQIALKDRNLKGILDNKAGDWPFVRAQQLVNLALRCCEMNRRDRPELSSDVWRVLAPMRASCGTSSRLIPGEQSQSPEYFICPIFQDKTKEIPSKLEMEVMQDPVVAADGYTYEAEAIRGWLDGGRDTSPMTNLKLAHTNLLPNHALRSAIQQWSQNKMA